MRKMLTSLKGSAINQAAVKGGKFMTSRTLTIIALGAGLLMAGTAFAQQQPAPAAPPAPPNLDAVPDKMPFATPYGAPITMDRAQAAIQAAVAEANKRGWALNVAVVDPNGDLVAFGRMDGAQLASIAISQHKARVAARYRRPLTLRNSAGSMNAVKNRGFPENASGEIGPTAMKGNSCRSLRGKLCGSRKD